MLVDISVALGLAFFGSIVILMLFKSVQSANITVSTANDLKKKQAPKASKAASAPVSPKGAAPAKLTKKQRKEEAERKRKEAEENAVVEKNAKSVAGMTTDKNEVIIWSDKSKAKAQAVQSPKQSVTQTEHQKVVERARGFKVIETAKPKPASPTAASGAPSHKEQLDKKLSQFFKSHGKKRGGGGGGDEGFGGGRGRGGRGRGGQDGGEAANKEGGHITIHSKVSHASNAAWSSEN